MNYRNLFNEQYINQQHYEKIKIEQFFSKQQELTKLLKALNDFIDSYNKIAPQYQKQVFDACVNTICKKIYENTSK